jgi:hypothetical protein
MPYTETVAPKRMKLRSDNVDPSDKKSRTENDAPKYDMENIANVDPNRM